MNTAKLKSNALPIIIILGSVLIAVSLVYFYKSPEFAKIIDDCGEEIEIDKTVSEERAVEVAKQWIKHFSPTYRERSDRREIELVDVTTRDEGEYEVILQFTTGDDGFGHPEEGEEVESGEFERTAKVLMYYDYVSMVAIDNVWCDYDRREITKEEIEYWTPPRYAEEAGIEEEIIGGAETGEILHEETREENGETIQETEIKYEEEGIVEYSEAVFDSLTNEWIRETRLARDAETGEVVSEIEDWTETDEETGEEIRVRELKNIKEKEIIVSRVRTYEGVEEGDSGYVSKLTTYDLETGAALKEIVRERSIEGRLEILIATELNLKTGEKTKEREVKNLMTGEVIKKEVID